MGIFTKRQNKSVNVKITTVFGREKPYVICDTNVWYEIASDRFTKPDDVLLIPTSFSLEEIASSKMMANSTKYYQHVLKSIYQNCGPIIQENPLDYVLSYLDPHFPVKEQNTTQLLKGFSELMARVIDEKEITDELKLKINEDCEHNRKPSKEFSELINQELIQVRKNINTGMGKKEHLKKDATAINKNFIRQIFDGYAKTKNYSINWDKFEWERIELFLHVTETFFKKLETTKDMKVDPNDIVDWFNILYVTPDDKYLTFDKQWSQYILDNDRIKHYLYK